MFAAVLFPVSLLAQVTYVSIDSTIMVSGEAGSVGVYLNGNEHDLLGAVVWLKYDKTAIILDSVSFEGSIFYPYEEWRVNYEATNGVNFVIIEDLLYTEHVYLASRNGLLATLYFRVDDFAGSGDYAFYNDVDSCRFGPRTMTDSTWADILAPVFPGLVAVTSCCVGERGNVDADVAEEVTVADVMALVDYAFTPPFVRPSCLLEADMDGNGWIDIADIMWLVEYMYGDGGLTVMGCE